MQPHQSTYVPSPPTLVVAVLFAICLMPALLVEIPAMIDYVNHLARMHLLAGAAKTDANPAYVLTSWKLYPNLAVDFLVPLLAHVMSVEFATKVFLLVSQALVVTGTIAIEVAVRRRHEIGGFAALLVLFSLPFAWGILNFMFATGVSLWAIAAWIAFKDRGWMMRLAIHSTFVLVLFFSHFFVLGIYGITIGLIELFGLFSQGFALRRTLWLVLLMAAPVVVLIAMMLVTGGTFGGGGGTIDFDWTFKLIWPLRFMNVYDLKISIGTGITLILFLAFMFRKGWLTLTGPGKWIAVGFLALYLVLPHRLFDSAYNDVRVITAAALILPGFMIFRAPSTVKRRACAVFAAAIILVNALSVGAIWLSYQKDYATMKSSFALIIPKSSVLVGYASDHTRYALDQQAIYYAPTLAVHYAHAFVPSLYTYSGLLPLAKAPAYARFEIINSLDYLPTPLSILQAVASEGSKENIPSHVRDWTRDYDYLYLVGNRAPNPMPDLLDELAAGERFSLYRIQK